VFSLEHVVDDVVVTVFVSNTYFLANCKHSKPRPTVDNQLSDVILLCWINP
jgi:hypothetical protein